MSIGENLQRIRTERKLTQKELSEKMNISRSYLSDIENNRKNPSSKTLQLFAHKLGVSMLYITTGEKHISDMAAEEQDEYLKNDLKLQIKYVNVKEYEKKTHVQIEDFLDNEERNFYINNHKLSNEDMKALIALYKGKENNYPSNEQIEKEYEEIKKNNEEYQKQIDSGESFFPMSYRYDINTNEEVEHDIHTSEDTKTNK